MLGYCLGGTLAASYVAAFPEHVASLLALAAPIDFEHAGIMATWTRTPTFDVGALVEAFGNVPWPLMQASFNMLRPTLRAAKTVALLDRAWDDEFLDGFLATEHWGNDNVSFPGACYARYIEELYRGNRLIHGGFTRRAAGPARAAADQVPGARARVRATTTSCRCRARRRSIDRVASTRQAARRRSAAATSARSCRARPPIGCGR